jgi:hypothetical protein
MPAMGIPVPTAGSDEKPRIQQPASKLVERDSEPSSGANGPKLSATDDGKDTTRLESDFNSGYASGLRGGQTPAPTQSRNASNQDPASKSWEQRQTDVGSKGVRSCVPRICIRGDALFGVFFIGSTK